MTVVDSDLRRFRHRRRTPTSLLAIALVIGWTVVKLLAVLVVALNGLCAGKVQDRLLALDGQAPSRRLLLTSVGVATVSQVGWWLATAVGFLNAQQ